MFLEDHFKSQIESIRFQCLYGLLSKVIAYYVMISVIAGNGRIARVDRRDIVGDIEGEFGRVAILLWRKIENTIFR